MNKERAKMSKLIHIEKDTLSKDLLKLIVDATKQSIRTDKDYNEILMMKLVSYIVRRDHKVYNHAYKIGKDSNG